MEREKDGKGRRRGEEKGEGLTWEKIMMEDEESDGKGREREEKGSGEREVDERRGK